MGYTVTGFVLPALLAGYTVPRAIFDEMMSCGQVHFLPDKMWGKNGRSDEIVHCHRIQSMNLAVRDRMCVR